MVKNPDDDKTVRICSYFTVAEAELNKNLLENCGVKARIMRGNLGVASEFSGSAGDAYLIVRKKDFNKAREILNLPPITEQ